MKIFKTEKRGETHMPYMDNENAERLVNTYADTILRISYMYLKETHDAEDICQNVFLKLLSKDIHFDNSSHEKAWIIRATINACKDNVNHNFQQSVLIDRADDKTDVCRRTVAIEYGALTFRTVIAEHTHHGNIFLIRAYNGSHGNIQGGKRQHNTDNKYH